MIIVAILTLAGAASALPGAVWAVHNNDCSQKDDVFGLGELIYLCGNDKNPEDTYFWWELLDTENNKARVAASAQTDCIGPTTDKTDSTGGFGPIDTAYTSSVVTDLRVDVHFCDGSLDGVELSIKRDTLLPSPPVPEAPTLVLFMVGLLGIAGYMMFRKY